MGKIRDYAEALTAKLTDLFVIDTEDSSVHSTKSVSLETMGKTIAGTQTHSSLTTTSKTMVGAINEVDGKTDNDISHYTGTPTAGTTAEAIANLIKKDTLSGTTNPNGLITFDHTHRKIICAICTSANYVLFQIQGYVIVKKYNDLTTITNEAVTFDYWYIDL